jgi:hypothetical protein
VKSPVPCELGFLLFTRLHLGFEQSSFAGVFGSYRPSKNVVLVMAVAMLFNNGSLKYFKTLPLQRNSKATRSSQEV